MGTTGNTNTNTSTVKIQWGYCSINPIAQVIEHYYNQRKKHG